MSTLGYWAIRGLGQPIRCLLIYVGEDFREVQYDMGDAPDFSHEEWLRDKVRLGDVLDFPNLPYYISGDIKLTQSNAILKHIARKHGLDGADDKEKAHVDMLLDCAMDLRHSSVRLSYDKDYENVKEEYFKNIRSSLALYEKKLKGNDWFAGNKITVADFPFYELLTQLQMMKPGIYEDYPEIRTFLQRFENLPKIKEYVASSEVKSLLVHSKMAAFK